MNYYHYHIHIKGLVQGIGFRPFIYRIATETALCGSVYNSNDGVHITYQTSENNHRTFLRRIRKEAPEAAVIEQISVRREPAHQHITGPFRIGQSRRQTQTATRLSPDIAICRQCLADRKKQPQRKDYPFTNCTCCGPRYTIVERMPYDRPFTAMKSFKLCDKCKAEYENPTDRRFHAQPIACNQCGPHYTGLFAGKTLRNYPDIITETVRTLAAGGIIALKGLGGYVLICHADNDTAIEKLRNLKGRYGKPLAVMYASSNTARNDVWINPQEEKELTSWQRPIVLLKTKKAENPLLNNGYTTIGVILPYMAIHYDLFEHPDAPKRIVFTSCNISSQPIVTDDREASDLWSRAVDGIISYNREITNRIDDSVLRFICKTPLLLRRARGYVPEPIKIGSRCDGILACGAQQISQFAIGINREALLSPYIGSLDYYPNRTLYLDTFKHFCQMFNFTPQTIIADLHPQYYTRNLHFPRTTTLLMQHHHAHAVSCMVENHLNKEVLALCLDGTGYGDDGRIWGGVLMKCDRRSYHALQHLPFIDTPDGNTMARQTWRSAAAWIKRSRSTPPSPWAKRIGNEKIGIYSEILHKTQTVKWSSTGRLFDAVASISGITDENRYSGEAPQQLEHAACKGHIRPIALPGNWEAAWDSLFRNLCRMATENTPASDIAATFHFHFAGIWTRTIIPFSRQLGIKEIMLTGGCMQNKLLTELLYQKLSDAGLTVCLHSNIPCNDAGIAIGQIAYGASLKRNNNKHA